MNRDTLALTQGPKNKLGAAVTTGLAQQSGDVPLYRAAAQAEGAGDGAIVQALEHEGEHAPLRPADADRVCGNRGGECGGALGKWLHALGGGEFKCSPALPQSRSRFRGDACRGRAGGVHQR